MNVPFLTRLKRLVAPELDPSSGTGLLSEDELRAAHALLQVLAADPDCSESECRRWVCERTSQQPGRLKAYREGLALLRGRAERLFPGRDFPALAPDERERVLRGLIRSYPHEELEPRWRRRLRLTAENVDLLLARRACRRFRDLVVRDLLERYYTSASGWAVVGYRDFPGHARVEDEPCEVIGLQVEGSDLWLELSDTTIERLDPRLLEADEERGLAVVTKAGRQRATFTHAAYHRLAEMLEEAENGLVLRVGDRVHRILGNDAEG